VQQSKCPLTCIEQLHYSKEARKAQGVQAPLTACNFVTHVT
jgi:hypothetical protein